MGVDSSSLWLLVSISFSRHILTFCGIWDSENKGCDIQNPNMKIHLRLFIKASQVNISCDGVDMKVTNLEVCEWHIWMWWYNACILNYQYI
jgi:hypothetical protein